MNQDDATKVRRDALLRAAELESRWQDAIAQRQRASDLFSGWPKLERRGDSDDDPR
jgi:hypothetical protein